MAADGALSKNHQRARENVGALNGDPYGRALPCAAEIVLWPKDNALAAVDVHGVLDDFAAIFGGVGLGDGAGHGRALAGIDRCRRLARQGADGVGVAGNSGQRLFDSFKAAYGQVELLANSCVGDRKSTRLNSSHVAISYAV